MAEFRGEVVIGVTQILGKGSVNQVFVVKTATRPFVVRLNEDEIYFDEYQKERWCIEQARLVGIPGPTVLDVGKLDGSPYIIESLVEGINGEDAVVPGRVAIWQKLGSYSRLINSIEAFPPPDITPARFDNFREKWPAFLAYNIASLTENDPLLALDVFNREQSAEIKRRFVALQGRVYNFGLLHRDIGPRNTIVEPSGQVVLLDWGCAEINIVPQTELAALLDWQISDQIPNETEFKAFLKGYGLGWADFECMKPEVEILLLLRSIDTVRWAIERKPERIQELAAKARKVRELLFPEF